VVAAASLDGTEAILAEFRKFLFLMIPLVLATASLGGDWISRRALSPVDEITRTAQSISVRSLSMRLPVPPTGDELQRMSETWNAVLERLEATVNRIRQFTADASHELRTPIALIRATADLALQRKRSTEDYQKALANIRDEAERMTELVESLLALARSDANGLVLPRAAVDVNGIVRDVISSNLALAESQGVVLSTDLAEFLPPVIGNAAALRRLLLSLVDNAIKYTPANGHVAVRTSTTANEVLLTVEDTGSGIEPEALPHIFERFYRADTTRSFGSGAGLGLSIAQAIAEAHGSIITVESSAAVGSRFHLSLRAD
jgi:heavy metal sensor kinase